jgi:hypothetical protein
MAANPDAAVILDASAPAHTAEGPRDEVIRPTGLGRGVWEGPSWLFVVVTVVVVIVGLAFLVERIGIARIRALFRRGSK